MSRIHRRLAPAIALLASAAMLAGCGEGPTRAASAAVVGEEAIPLEEVQQETSWLVNNLPEARQAEQEGNLALYSRHILQTRVVSELLDVTAQREGLSADPQEVNERIDALGGRDEAPQAAGISPERVEDFVGEMIMLEELGRQYADGLSVDVVGSQIAQEEPGDTLSEQALELGEQIAAEPERAAELAGQQGVLIDETLEVSELLNGQGAQLATSALFSAEPGTVVLFQPSREQPIWLVALITDRNVEESEAEQADAPDVDPQILQALGLRMLAPIVDEVGVDINPRYGVWDSVGMNIAQSEEHVAGHLIPARTAEP